MVYNLTIVPDDCLMQPSSKRPREHFKATQPDTRLDLERILQARQEISRVFRDTPQFECPALGTLLGCQLVVKLETANPIGCFKGRGTEVVMSSLARGRGPKVAVCASAGNLGQALAYSGRTRGIAVTVIAGTSANAAKITVLRELQKPELNGAAQLLGRGMAHSGDTNHRLSREQ